MNIGELPQYLKAVESILILFLVTHTRWRYPRTLMILFMASMRILHLIKYYYIATMAMDMANLSP